MVVFWISCNGLVLFLREFNFFFSFMCFVVSIVILRLFGMIRSFLVLLGEISRFFFNFFCNLCFMCFLVFVCIFFILYVFIYRIRLVVNFIIVKIWGFGNNLFFMLVNNI